ncbi:hypothetical protein CAEBREN_04336 [Caenorhabditis brenneri]|uniref:F-box domain-containing protein n=1 Tax=Caenorhabditis brenneri TaxID=135651 RepID=G0NBE0_CAEBE|nr:hypothetical protein CAEBREN_04336 [Caenorhabditis brenneri]
MKLLKFPFLVQNRIIKTMSVTETVILSFCSAKTKRIIKNSRWIVSFVRFRLEKQQVLIDLFYNKTHVETLMLVFKHVNQFSENTETVHLKNIELELRFVKLDWKLPADEYFPELDFDVIQVLDECSNGFRIELYKHLLDLFQTTPRVPIIWFGSKFRELERVVVETTLKGQPMENSKLSLARNLVIEKTQDQVNFIKHFKGQVGSFKKCECDISFIIEIIELWISNKAFQSLDYLSMTTDNFLAWNENDVVQAIETHPWNPMKRPQNYGKSYEILHWNISPLECAYFRDVTSETDGKLASFSILSSSFQFVVWN